MIYERFYLASDDRYLDLVDGPLKLRRVDASPGTIPGQRRLKVTYEPPAEDDDGHRALVNILEHLLATATRYAEDTLTADAVWLELHAPGERATRALVKSGQGPWRESCQFALQILAAGEEDDADAEITSVPNADCLGAAVQLSGRGTEPSRISLITSKAVAGASYFNEMRFGLKPTTLEAGATSDFDPIWSLHAGTVYTGSVTHLAWPTDAHLGNAIRMNYGATIIIGTSLDEVYAGPNYSHFVGRYLLLLRYTIPDADTNIRLKVYSGYPLRGQRHVATYYMAPVFVDESWTLAPIAYVTIPSGALRAELAHDEATQYSEILLEFDWLSGSSYFWIDCMTLMPADHMCTVVDQQVGTGKTYLYHELHTNPDGRVEALAFDSIGSQVPQNPFLTGPVNFALPTDGAVLVYTAQRYNAGKHQHYYQDLSDLTITVRRRWASHRRGLEASW